MPRPRPLSVALAVAAAALAVAALAPGALAALPRTYQVQTIDSPTPVTSGAFGMSLVGVGDVNGDGKADVLTGVDKHGVAPGQSFVFSGADGSTLRTYDNPDLEEATPPAGDRPAGFGNQVAVLPDITGDGVAEHLIGESGFDTPAPDPNGNDLGQVFVFNGATGALIKRIRMPAADRAEQIASANNDPRFGRAILSPSATFQAAGVITPLPTAVQRGDVTGDNVADVIISATDTDETKATAHPASPCATQGGAVACSNTGRVYVYSGADLTGSAATPLDAPVKTIKDPLSAPDEIPAPSPFANDDGFGILLIPMGDAGSCTGAAPADPGARCATPPSNTRDGVPDFGIAITGVDLYGMQEVGEVLEIDGAKLSNIKATEYPDPRPEASWGQAQNGIVYPAVGDVSPGTGASAVDIYMPDIQWNGDKTAQGRGMIVNGAPTTAGSFREIPARFASPTPATGEQFGLSAAGVGDVDGDARNDILIGAMGPHNPATDPKVINDITFFNGLNEAPLQTIAAPDQQGGEAFGVAMAPLGDLNGDGFLDLAVGAGLYDLTRTSGACSGAPCTNAGRMYILRSDNSPGPPPPGPPPAGPQGAQGSAGSQGSPGSSAAAATLAGRTLELSGSASTVKSGKSLRLRGALEAFANQAGCERGVTVQIQQRSGSTPRYKNLTTARTDNSGDFSISVKPLGTTFYRAVVSQTSQCLGAASNREKVSVTKKKSKTQKK